MVSVLQTIDTNHEDIIHDAQLDYYGTMLATGSSDCSVKVFSIKDKKQILLADLKGHQGPVWGVAWANPIFGGILASCSYDKTVIIWQQSNGKWSKLYVHQVHESSVNGIAWAPHELGLILACASSDGKISILEPAQDGQWEVSIISDAHPLGVNGVSWSPIVNVHSMLNPTNPDPSSLPMRLVSGGCDSLVKIWRQERGTGRWLEEARLEGHQDWVRDVAWAPSLTDQREQIASCAQDGRVILWQRFPTSQNTVPTCTTSEWHSAVIHTYPDIVWHVSWNITGNMLAVSGADNTVTLWKENLEGRWVALSQIQRGITASNTNTTPNTGNRNAVPTSVPQTLAQPPMQMNYPPAQSQQAAMGQYQSMPPVQPNQGFMPQQYQPQQAYGGNVQYQMPPGVNPSNLVR